MISYYDFTDHNLMYAKKVSGSWFVETVEHHGVSSNGFGDVGQWSSLALHPDTNVPAIAHLQADTTGQSYLRFASREGGAWTVRMPVEDPSDADHYGYWTSLKFNAAADPWVSFQDSGNDRLRFAFMTNPNDWSFETVDSAGDVGGYTSLSIDSNDRPNISYYDYSNGNLKYARRPEGPGGSGWWAVQVVDAADEVGQFTSLVVNDSGPHISYYDVTNSALKVAHGVGSTWQKETVDSPGVVGQWTSLAAGSDGALHVAYFDSSNTALKYARRASGSWNAPVTVDASGVVGEYCSIALDGSDHPHIAYYDTTSHALKHAWHNGTSWTTERVDCQDAVITGTLPSGQSTITLGLGSVNLAEIDAYYYLNRMHQYIYQMDSTWISPTPVPTAIARVDYNVQGGGGRFIFPDTVLFRYDQDEAPSVSLSRSRVEGIVAHEYTHLINYLFTGGMTADGMEEGNANIGATFMTDSPDVLRKFEGCEIVCPPENPNECDCENTLAFPQDVIGLESHLAGFPLCGFNWDARRHIGDVSGDPDFAKAHTAALWHYSRKLFGYKGYTMPEQVFDYWLLDGGQYSGAIEDAAKDHGFLDDIILSNGTEWAVDSITTTQRTDPLESPVRLGLDRAARPHIAFRRDETEDEGDTYRYMMRASASWIVEDIDEAGVGALIDLGLTLFGRPAVVYAKSDLSTPADLWFAERLGADDWNLDEFFTGGSQDRVTGLGLEIQASGVTHVGYSLATTGEPLLPKGLYYAKRGPDGQWTVTDQQITSGGTFSDIDVSGSGTIGMLYTLVNALKYIWSTNGGTNWTIETVDQGGPGPHPTAALDFDAAGVAHVSYSFGNQLRYAARGGTPWSIPESVDVAPHASMPRGLYSSIAVGEDGIRHISYHDGYSGDLRYATRGDEWSRQTVDRPKDTGEFTSLQLDLAGNPVIAYSRRTDGRIRIATSGKTYTPHPYKSTATFETARGAPIEAAGDYVPQVVRLCPEGDYDTLTATVTVRDILGEPLEGVPLSIVETEGTVLIGSEGLTSNSTNSYGEGEVTLFAGSDNGRVGICADGVILALAEVRSPDVAGASTGSAGCPIPGSGTSTVEDYDRDNEECGFETKVGVVTPGVNQGWDLNGDESVDSLDVDGWPEGQSVVGGWAQHFEHSGELGAGGSCGGSGKAPSRAAAGSPRMQPAPEASPSESAPFFLPPGRDLAVIPNPSAGNVHLAWRSQPGESGRAEIYDVTGRRLRTFPFEAQADAVRMIEWDGTASNGPRYGSGVYFVRLVSPSRSLVEKFVLVR